MTGVTEAPAGGPRVVIAEDSVLLLAGLTKLLESAGFEVAATAGDADGLLAAVEREQPDVVIADVRMPPTHTDEGIRAALVIRAQWPDIAILVLSQYVEERYAADLLSAQHRTASATCSRTGSPTWPSSSTRCAGSRRAAPRWTPRWWRSCWCAGAATRWTT